MIEGIGMLRFDETKQGFPIISISSGFLTHDDFFSILEKSTLGNKI